MNADNPGTGIRQVTIYPSPRLKSLYNLYLLVIVWCFVIPGLLVLILYIDPLTRVVISVIALILALLAIALIRMYLGINCLHVSCRCVGNPERFPARKTGIDTLSEDHRNRNYQAPPSFIPGDGYGQYSLYDGYR